MTLRQKTLVIVGVTLLGLLVVFYGLTRVTLLHNFERLEERQTRADVERAKAALDSATSVLSATARDDSIWDEAYSFLTTHDPRFPSNAFNADSFKVLHVDHAVYIDRNGTIVSGQSYDPTTH